MTNGQKLAPPPPMPKAPAKAATAAARTVTFAKPHAKVRGMKGTIFGGGGMGKTTMICLAPGPVAIIDLENSLGTIAKTLPADADVRIVSDVTDWNGLLAVLRGGGWDDIATVAVDSATIAEEWAAAWVLANVKGDKGAQVARLTDFGYGKELNHIYDTFLGLLMALDAHAAAGRNVVLIAHDCTTSVPNPEGEDYLRYEPRLQSPASGKNSIRHRVREWGDFLLYIGMDRVVDKDGKARASGSRTIQPDETAWCMAKSRTFHEAMPVIYIPGTETTPADAGTLPDIWRAILGQ